MHHSARRQFFDSPHDDMSRNRRDPVVVQAIANVTAELAMEEWWALAPGVRTHAIYDEIRRLDLAWADAADASVDEDADRAHYQIA
jgi:hypothetical protein